MVKNKRRNAKRGRVEQEEVIDDKAYTEVDEVEPIEPRTEGQKKFLQTIKDYDLIICNGPAGTGKTFLSVALALEALSKGEISKIIVTRPVVEAGEKLGYLPGDLKEKIDPYLRPIYDALATLIGVEKYKLLMQQEIIEVAPLAYMRGRTLENAFIILDEAQNTTLEQIIMIVTRLGQGSKLIVNGDATQIDLPKNKESGLVVLGHILGHLPSIGFHTFTEVDVVRHPIVKEVVIAYAAWKDKQVTHSK